MLDDDIVVLLQVVEVPSVVRHHDLLLLVLALLREPLAAPEFGRHQFPVGLNLAEKDIYRICCTGGYGASYRVECAPVARSRVNFRFASFLVTQARRRREIMAACRAPTMRDRIYKSSHDL